MKRRIFIGSSTEGLNDAQRICDLFKTFGDIEPVLWTTVFEPGFLTFEALEKMLLQCCAAVFVASPDDDGVIRGRAVKMPRANVMLEFGLVAGRIGRHSIALCLFGGVELPSDLKGLTYIEMTAASGESDADAKTRAAKQLQSWTDGLLATADMLARTDIVHGYSGRWDFELRLANWRGVEIVFPNYAAVKGSLDLMIFGNGQAGRGFAHGHLVFRLLQGAERVLFQGEYRTAHEITSAFCNTDGSLEFTSQAFAIQKVNIVGQGPPELTDLDMAPEPWSSRWRLSPVTEPRCLQGNVSTDNVVATVGSAKLTKA